MKKRKLKGYDQGGMVYDPITLDMMRRQDQVVSEQEQEAEEWDKTKAKPPSQLTPVERKALRAPDELGGYSRGGKIKKTIGKKIGKDSGMIPAQRGEYVVRKNAVKKYGAQKLNAVNKGTAKITTRKAK